MRTITFKLLTSANLEEFQTNARTFGELKSEIERDSRMSQLISFGNVKLFERKTKAEFGSLDEAILPEGNCVMFVVPNKTKSGARINLENATIAELKVEARAIMDKNDSAYFDLDGSAAELYDELSEYYDENPETPNNSVVIDRVVADLNQATSILNNVISTLLEANLVDVEELSSEAIQLQAEAKALISKLH